MEEKTINIMDLVLLAWHRLWIIILAAVVFAASAFGYCNFFLTPSYSATASLLVTNGGVNSSYDDSNDKVSGSDISASLYLTYTVVDILNTPDIYKKVADQLGDNYSYQQLINSSSVARRNEDTLFIDVTFSSTDPKEAMRIANKFVEISCQYIPEFIPSSKASVASTAIKASMTYPRTFSTTAAAGVVGAVAAYVVLFIIESMNHAIKGEEDFANNFDIPLLGSVPDFENAESGGYRKNKNRGGVQQWLLKENQTPNKL